MDKIIQYMKDNPNYTLALIITAAVLILACVLGYFVQKYNLLKFTDKWFKRKGKDNEPEKTENPPKDRQPAEPEQVSQSDDIVFEDPAVAFADLTVKEDVPTPETDTEADEPIEEDEAVLPQKKSKLSEMLEKSMQQEVAEEYEEEKKRTTSTVKPIATTEEKTEIPPISQENEDYEGKWRIMRAGNTFVAELYTDDEILLIKSQRYSAFSDAKQSIETLKKNIEGNNFTVAVNKNGEFYFKLFSPSGRLICCGEPCKTRDDCKLAIEAVKRIAFKAEVVRG